MNTFVGIYNKVKVFLAIYLSSKSLINTSDIRVERRLQIVVYVQLLGGPATRQVLGVQIPLVEHDGIIGGHVVQIFSANFLII